MKSLNMSKKTLGGLCDVIEAANDVVKFQLRDFDDNHHLWYSAHKRLISSYERYLSYLKDDIVKP